MPVAEKTPVVSAHASTTKNISANTTINIKRGQQAIQWSGWVKNHRSIGATVVRLRMA
jgi:hypothetical protein